MSTELEQVTLAVAAINKVEAGLAALRENYGGVVYQVTTTEGMDAAKVARRAIREPRFEVEKIRKAAKAPILALGKLVDSEAARITRELTLIEAPIDEQITAEEDRKEKEKEAKIAAELARTQEIQRRIDGIREWPVKAAGKAAALVSQMLQGAADFEATEEVFQERLEEAKSTLVASVAALQGIYQERLQSEAKERQVELDRIELARLKSEEAERQRVAAEERAKQEAADKTKRDSEAAAQAEANRIERERIAKEEADAKAIRDAETKRIAAERADNERIARERQADLDAQAETQRKTLADEAGRLAADRAKFEADQEAARIAAQPKPEPVKTITSVRTIERPTTAQLVECVANHYKVSTEMAQTWLRNIRWEQAAA